MLIGIKKNVIVKKSFERNQKWALSFLRPKYDLEKMKRTGGV